MIVFSDKVVPTRSWGRRFKEKLSRSLAANAHPDAGTIGVGRGYERACTGTRQAIGAWRSNLNDNEPASPVSSG
jgi:hypothetical protein